MWRTHASCRLDDQLQTPELKSQYRTKQSFCKSASMSRRSPTDECRSSASDHTYTGYTDILPSQLQAQLTHSSTMQPEQKRVAQGGALVSELYHNSTKAAHFGQSVTNRQLYATIKQGSYTNLHSLLTWVATSTTDTACVHGL